MARKKSRSITRCVIKHGPLKGFCEYQLEPEGISPAAITAAVMQDLDNFNVAITPGGIERQEAAGQARIVKEENLPIRMPWATLDKLGFKKGSDMDLLFRSCTFPAGWRKLPFIDHSMWNHILDGKNRVRGSFFYKAAFYDQSAHGTLQSRYEIRTHYGKKESKFIRVVDNASKYNEKTGRAVPKVLFEREVEKKEDWKDQERAENWCCLAAGVWLAERFPDWEDVTAYWD